MERMDLKTQEKEIELFGNYCISAYAYADPSGNKRSYVVRVEDASGNLDRKILVFEKSGPRACRYIKRKYAEAGMPDVVVFVEKAFFCRDVISDYFESANWYALSIMYFWWSCKDEDLMTDKEYHEERKKTGLFNISRKEILPPRFEEVFPESPMLKSKIV